MVLSNRKYIDTASPLLKIEDNRILYNSEIVKVKEYEIGMDTASISYGVNEKAKEISDNAYIEETVENLFNNPSDYFSLETGTDGHYGNVTMFETIENVPVLIMSSGYIDKDMQYTKEELKDYFVDQMQIKNVEINYDKEINI